MGTITWEPVQRRLRLAGSCDEQDRDRVQEALAGSEDEGRVLIIDLTAVTSLAPEVAELILETRDRPDGRRVSVLRRKGSAADQVLIGLETA